MKHNIGRRYVHPKHLHDTKSEYQHHHPNDTFFHSDCKRCRIDSASPELLEASKRALDLLCTSYENGIAQIKLEYAGDIIGHLKEAIAKAKGGKK